MPTIVSKDVFEQLAEAQRAEQDAQAEAQQAAQAADDLAERIESGDTKIGAEQLSSARSLRDYWAHRRTAAQRKREQAEQDAQAARVEALVTDVANARQSLSGVAADYDNAVRALRAMAAKVSAYNATVAQLERQARALAGSSGGRIVAEWGEPVIVDGAAIGTRDAGQLVDEIKRAALSPTGDPRGPMDGGATQRQLLS